MAIVKMKYVSVATDESHIDEMVLDGVHSGLLHAVHAADIINEDNGGHLINDENPYSGYLQTLQNFAHSVNYTLDPERAPKKHYTNEEMDAFAESGVDDRHCKLRSGSGGRGNSHERYYF